MTFELTDVIMYIMKLQEFRPTYLYIKRHSVTGLLYFGKTVKQDPVKYLGSGRYWGNHIMAHGKEYVETLWYCLFYDSEECNKFAINFSIQEDIVASKQWANQDIETGFGGRQMGCKGFPGSSNPNFGNRWSDKQRNDASLRCIGRNKGKTYEEIYGLDLAQKLKNDRKISTAGKDNAGKKNPRALRIKAISPNKEEFIIEGEIAQFCKKHNLGEKNVRISSMTGKPHYLGWKFECLGSVHLENQIRYD